MPLILNNLPPLHWAVAGAGIAAITVVLLFVTNRRLGLSSGFDDICGLVLRQPYFRRPQETEARAWRLPFLAGLVLGGALSAALGGGWAPTWTIGVFDQAVDFK